MIIDNKQLYLIEWQDAAFSFRKKIPKSLPSHQVTIGYLLNKNQKFIKIAFNFRKNKQKLSPLDGFIIPRKTIIKIIKLKCKTEKKK
ncbi:MAG: hypothetical protein KatS3mg095_0638 [Candidatus Parcubacteria bacterium]|nr:MAG: hypothetical protein KatS3mg095_0638 [Candidatus Parcubacteria bacterium]